MAPHHHLSLDFSGSLLTAPAAPVLAPRQCILHPKARGTLHRVSQSGALLPRTRNGPHLTGRETESERARTTQPCSASQTSTLATHPRAQRTPAAQPRAVPQGTDPLRLCAGCPPPLLERDADFNSNALNICLSFGLWVRSALAVSSPHLCHTTQYSEMVASSIPGTGAWRPRSHTPACRLCTCRHPPPARAALGLGLDACVLIQVQ